MTTGLSQAVLLVIFTYSQSPYHQCWIFWGDYWQLWHCLCRLDWYMSLGVRILSTCPFQCLEITWNANRYSCLLKCIQHTKVYPIEISMMLSVPRYLSLIIYDSFGSTIYFMSIINITWACVIALINNVQFKSLSVLRKINHQLIVA